MGGGGGNGGSPILAIQKDSTSQERQQAISVGCWRLVVEGDLGGGEGNGGAVYCQCTIAEAFLTLQVS